MEIIKLSPWNDPVTYALPGFILSILAEAYILFVKRKQKINKKDASASLSLGLGVVFLDLAFKPLFLALGLFLFKFRILEHIGPGSVEEFFDLSWHKAHWYLWVVASNIGFPSINDYVYDAIKFDLSILAAHRTYSQIGLVR